MRKDRWSEDIISGRICDVVSQVFSVLYESHPDQDHSEYRPRLLRLDADAREAFAAYYNECGDAAMEGDEREEAAWSKLSGYAARLALIGQLARDPLAETVTGEVMQAACDLARWFGAEAVRIYATLAETSEQREQRRLTEYIEARGGVVRVRELMQSCAPLKNQKAKAEAALSALVDAGLGKWEQVPTTPRGGHPTREFQLLRASTSTSTQPLKLWRKTVGSVDVDEPKSQKITPSWEPGTETESLIGDELGVARL
jgi:Protein of unknown function (DUF3987)